MSAQATMRSSRRTSVRPRRSIVFTVLTALLMIYALIPLVWLLISSTKTQADYVSTFGFAFGDSFALFDNIRQTFEYRDGIFGRWFLNTLMYVVVGAGGAPLLAILGGYVWPSTSSRAGAG